MNVRLLLALILLAARVSWASGPSVRYVYTNSPSPNGFYLSWDTAAHTIQDAVNVSVLAGDEVIVTDGVYSAGSAFIPTSPSMSNRVVITNAVYVHSVNGPTVTIIKGEYDPNAGGPGSNAVRCAYIKGGGILAGFTLADGATSDDGVSVDTTSAGGLILFNGTVSNCVITRCKASGVGGGVFFGSPSTLMSHCVIVSNSTPSQGGGAWFNNGGTMRNCLVVNNIASSGGGASIYRGTLENCTISGNHAGSNGGLADNGSPPVYTSRVVNCIIIGNTASIRPEYFAYSNVINFCCTQPLPTSGVGNISANPQFLGKGEYHLRATSPCVDAGTNLAWMAGAKDIDGEPRVRGTAPDMGADEAYQFMAIASSRDAGNVTTTWDTILDAAFRLQFSADLLSGDWSDVGDVVTSVLARATVTETNPPSDVRFYKMIYVGP